MASGARAKPNAATAAGAAGSGSIAMRLSVYALFVFTSCLAASAEAAEAHRYLQLVNRANDSVTSVQVSARGDEAFESLPIVTPLRGGGDSTTVRIAGDGCAYDFRFVFRDGRTLAYRDVDVCRADVLRIRRPPHAADARMAASQGD
ncbi:hypothetical protein FCE95_02525 [Luteimonas gilva]|uniref:Uncharacterized protein n=1 Tax=Luteimonas gilva TaxID=2572684 RepID=A0A4U5JTP8_9GAMM|nr:hypothetical protein [Luteimonas gilva]TKR33204.1 hypothetical protein FCE95_02525 [Luteimonas gilva]